jgi:hypothetical protein
VFAKSADALRANANAMNNSSPTRAQILEAKVAVGSLYLAYMEAEKAAAKAKSAWMDAVRDHNAKIEGES